MKHLPALLACLLFSCVCVAKTHVEIAEQNAQSVVAVNVVKKDGSTFTGTGFVVSQNGLIATSRHVSDNALFINITFNNGAVSDEAKVAAESQLVDLALLKIPAQGLPTVTLGDAQTVLPGQIITVIGNPRRLQNTVSSGLISQVRKKANGVIWHQISAPISPSSSGSPVFNENGDVISVAFASFKGDGNQNLNFAVPANYLAQLIDKAGYLPPLRPQAAPAPQNAFVRHIQKSWHIVKGWFGQNPVPAPAEE